VITAAELTPNDHAVAYRQGRERIQMLVGQLSEAQASTIVPTCPDWSVNHLCAHLAGVATDLVNRRNPTGDLQAWIDGHITDRSGRSAPELMDEWAEVSERFEQLIVDRPKSFAGLTYDVIAHEHDLRHALGSPGERDSFGITCALALTLPLLERDLGANGLGPVAIDTAPGERWQAGEGDPELILKTSNRFEALRLLGSRRSRSQLLAANWRGPQADNVEHFLPALDHLGLPTNDIIE
jgi:uncharacterized protein (TIGR03083 family)